MIKIASWNLCNFSKKKDMDPISDILQNFDIMAIQEVRDEESVKLLCNHANEKFKTNFEFLISDPVCSTKTSAHQTGKRKERYAIIYRNAKLVASDMVHGDECFVRPPLVAFFKCNKFDFVLATIHVVWGKKSDRRLEIANMNKLLSAIQERGNGEKDIILCGDFNTPPSEFSLPKEWKPLITTKTMVNSGNIYDNIWITRSTREYTGGAGVLCGAHKLSDHFPVYASFSDEDDDDGIPNINNITL